MKAEDILAIISDVKFSKEKGRFISDKSYAYDCIFFMAKFISRNINSSLVFDKNETKDAVLEYTKDIFQLTEKGSGAINYMTEAINLLIFGNVIKRDSNSEYRIINVDLFNFIVEKVENAFVFVYLIIFKTFQNENLLTEYCEMLAATELSEKTNKLENFFQLFISAPGQRFGKRTGNKDTQWSRTVLKFAINVLGFSNSDNRVTRFFNFCKNIASVEDISINLGGTRSNSKYPKKNDYIQHFDANYVKIQVKNYLLNKVSFDLQKPYINNSIAADLANLKLDIIANEKTENIIGDKFDVELYDDAKARTRNPNIQRAFRQALLQKIVRKCPICGFEYEECLIASHIKPYAKCEDTYDAINSNNGLLLCPNHDKLFEGAKGMTIDAQTGEIILSAKAKNSKDFSMLYGNFIDKSLVQCERKHYLVWHNNEFKRQQTLPPR